jgi:hypothetical protein
MTLSLMHSGCRYSSGIRSMNLEKVEETMTRKTLNLCLLSFMAMSGKSEEQLRRENENSKEALLVEALPTLRAYSNLLLNERSRFDENHLSKLLKAVEDAVDAYKNASGDLIIYIDAQVEMFRRAVR